MPSRWPFPDSPDDDPIPTRDLDLVAIFTVVELPGWPAQRPPALRVPHRPGQPDAVRTDEVTHGLRVIIDWVHEAVVVRAIGEVDLRNAGSLAQALRAGWGATRAPSLLVVDLTGTVFLSVAGLALLIATEQRCRERELPLRVVATTRSVLRALRITGLDVLFDITPTVVAAIRPWTTPEWTVRIQP